MLIGKVSINTFEEYGTPWYALAAYFMSTKATNFAGDELWHACTKFFNALPKDR